MFIAGLYACKTPVDNRIVLSEETENSVQIGETLVIFSGECKGCQYTPTFRFVDSLGIIKQTAFKRTDVCPECDGGSYGLEIEFQPIKTGKTVLNMYSEEWEATHYLNPETSEYERKDTIVETKLAARFVIDVKEKLK